VHSSIWRTSVSGTAILGSSWSEPVITRMKSVGSRPPSRPGRSRIHVQSSHGTCPKRDATSEQDGSQEARVLGAQADEPPRDSSTASTSSLPFQPREVNVFSHANKALCPSAGHRVSHLSRDGHQNTAHIRWTRLPCLFSKQNLLLMTMFVGYIMISIYTYLQVVPITDQAVHAVIRFFHRVELICAHAPSPGINPTTPFPQSSVFVRIVIAFKTVFSSWNSPFVVRV
jgi:hypothetical protein